MSRERKVAIVLMFLCVFGFGMLMGSVAFPRTVHVPGKIEIAHIPSQTPCIGLATQGKIPDGLYCFTPLKGMTNK